MWRPKPTTDSWGATPLRWPKCSPTSREPAEGGRVLDVGCGTGALTSVLARRYGESEVAAVDPSASFVTAVASRSRGRTCARPRRGPPFRRPRLHRDACRAGRALHDRPRRRPARDAACDPPGRRGRGVRLGFRGRAGSAVALLRGASRGRRGPRTTKAIAPGPAAVSSPRCSSRPAATTSPRARSASPSPSTDSTSGGSPTRSASHPPAASWPRLTRRSASGCAPPHAPASRPGPSPSR